MTRLVAIAATLAVACSDPPTLTLKYALTAAESQRCYANLGSGMPATSCMDVAMPCAMDLDVRIVSASDPTNPLKEYIRVCQPVIGRKDLCSIAGIPLPAPTQAIPEQTLAVEVGLYRDELIGHDTATGDPICPDDLAFSADGLLAPTSTAVVGGISYYHPGDTETVVALGCADQMMLQAPSCLGTNTIAVTATVEDFDSNVSVPPSLADRLQVLVGEPLAVISGSSTQYVLEPSHARSLDRTVTGPVPGWGAAVDIPLISTACIEVLDDVPQATPSLACGQIGAGTNQVNRTGVRLSRATLDQILVALSDTEFPPDGLVVGMVLDNLGNPASGVTVTASDAGRIDYLTPDRMRLQLGTTSSAGIFIAYGPYGTTYSAPAIGGSTPTAFGGVVQGKVTIVVLQYN